MRARRSRRFNIDLNERVLFLERFEDIWTVKRPKGRAPLNTYSPPTRGWLVFFDLFQIRLIDREIANPIGVVASASIYPG